MEILKNSILVLVLALFVLSGLAIRNDFENEHPIMTVIFCLSMGVLCCWN